MLSTVDFFRLKSAGINRTILYSGSHGIMKKAELTGFRLIAAGLFLLISVPLLPAESGIAENRIVVGAVEKIFLDPPGLSYPSRIDTGAAISSLNAYNLTLFSRNSRTWVRFSTAAYPDREARVVELPVERTVQVRQANRPGLQSRYIVLMDVRLGELSLSGEFSLADRRAMTYPLLIGRNFLAGNALVDVSREYIQK